MTLLDDGKLCKRQITAESMVCVLFLVSCCLGSIIAQKNAKNVLHFTDVRPKDTNRGAAKADKKLGHVEKHEFQELRPPQYPADIMVAVLNKIPAHALQPLSQNVNSNF